MRAGSSRAGCFDLVTHIYETDQRAASEQQYRAWLLPPNPDQSGRAACWTMIAALLALGFRRGASCVQALARFVKLCPLKARGVDAAHR